MSKPRYGWWSYAKYLTKKYPELKQEYDTIHSQHIAADLSKILGSSSNTSRSTEIVALLQLLPARQADYDAVTKAIEQTKRLKNGAERLRFIDMVFWKQSHNIDGAAYALGYSDITGKRFHSDFLRLVGFNRGLEDWE